MDNNNESTFEMTTLSDSTDSENIVLEISNEIQERQCRICFEEEAEDNILIYPCLCNGTSKYIHNKCLNRWRQQNIDKIAFFRCMECHFPYNILYKFPKETFKFSQHNISKFTEPWSLFSFNILVFAASLFFNSADRSIRFQLIHAFDLKPRTEFISILKENSLYASFFYFSFMASILNIILHSAFFLQICINLKTHRRYLKNTFLFYIIHILYTFHFFWLYYVFKTEKSKSGTMTYLNIEIILQSFSFWLFGRLMAFHNAIIHKLNVENSLQVINRE